MVLCMPMMMASVPGQRCLVHLGWVAATLDGSFFVSWPEILRANDSIKLEKCDNLFHPASITV